MASKMKTLDGNEAAVSVAYRLSEVAVIYPITPLRQWRSFSMNVDEISHWMEEHEYESLRQMCGSMNITHCPDPVALSRGHYRALLKSWQTGHVAKLKPLSLRQFGK